MTRFLAVLLAAAFVLSACGSPSARPSASQGNPAASTSAEPGTSPGLSTSEPGASQSPGTSPGAVHDFDVAYGPPQPVSVGVELSPLTFNSPVSVENGGFLTLLGPNGAFYQLTIPPNAVVSDTTVTMTAISSISGSPLGDELVAGVKLEPEGLQLLEPATLAITPPAPLAIADEGPFSAEGDGAVFHLFPLDPNPAALQMRLTHFSLFGLLKTDAERRADMIRNTAADVGAQLEQEIAAEIEKARNGDGTIDAAATEQKLNYYRDRVVRPMMALAESDHTIFREAVQKWLSWERQRGLLGFGGDEAFDGPTLDSFLRAFDNYVAHTIERCYEHDLGSMADLLSLARMASLMGFEERLDQNQAFDQIRKCATFTLEMDSTMEAQLNTCLLIDAGASDVQSMEHVTTAVEISGLTPGPWNAPIQWQAAEMEADCHLPAQGGDFFECQMSFAGFGDGGEFAVLGILADYNIIRGKAGVPPEETRAEFKINGIVVQPGDPQILSDGDCTLLETWSNSDTSSMGSGWLAGWKDNSAPVGREFIDDEEFDEAWVLTGWEPSSDIEIIATREYSGGTNSLFGTTNEHTTFILRHTPVR
jgi:hypothetical protein